MDAPARLPDLRDYTLIGSLCLVAPFEKISLGRVNTEDLTSIANRRSDRAIVRCRLVKWL